MTVSQITIKGLLALLIIIPLAIGITKFRTAGLTSRLFVFFLLVGFCTDLAMWLLITLKKVTILLTVFNIYSLLEALFFFWFLYATALTKPIRWSAEVCLYAVIPFWIICIFIYPYLTPGPRSALFDATYEVIISFLAAWALLQRAEKEASVHTSSVFWFTLGIFFYCFCTFYIMIFLETEISQQIWFLNNIINIITYGFYAVGFWKLAPARTPS